MLALYRETLTSLQQQGWEKLSLEYLSAFFGVEHTSPHRAWCDAEANAQVYLKLREFSPDGDSPA